MPFTVFNQKPAGTTMQDTPLPPRERRHTASTEKRRWQAGTIVGRVSEDIVRLLSEANTQTLALTVDEDLGLVLRLGFDHLRLGHHVLVVWIDRRPWEI